MVELLLLLEVEALFFHRSLNDEALAQHVPALALAVGAAHRLEVIMIITGVPAGGRDDV